MNLDKVFKFCSQKQKEAATQFIDKNLVILAAPGSGKTLTLTARIAFLLSKGVKPHQIFAVTFTKKGANDMKKRLASLLPPHFLLDGMALGTFHHCTLSILRANAKVAGVSWNFSVVSGLELRKIFEKALGEFAVHYDINEILTRPLFMNTKNGYFENFNEEPTSQFPLQTVISFFTIISNAKSDMKYYENLPNDLLKLFDIYNKHLRGHKNIDLFDLLFLTLRMFLNNKAILETYQKKYKYVLIDEFQDTNPMQLQFISLLAKHACVTICGDDDQAIYSWRGASSQIFSDFSELFPSETILLTQNYRSTQSIVKISQNIIQNNVARRKKDIFGCGEIGERPEVIIEETCKKEEETIAKLILFYVKKGFFYRNFAVLSRSNRTIVDLASHLSHKEIPIKSLEKKCYFNTSETGVFSFLKLILNCENEEAFMIVFNWPKRKLGEKAKKRIQYISNYKKLSMFHSLEFIVNNTQNPLKGFVELYTQILLFKEKSQNLSPADLVQYIIKSFNLKDCKQLEEIAEAYVDLGTLEFFLQSVDSCDETDKITLTTIHQAKGQEWDIVIIVRTNDGHLPLHNCDLEEERRLAYVAATRARKHLIFTCAMIGNQGDALVPSRFLEEFFAENLKRPSAITNNSN